MNIIVDCESSGPCPMKGDLIQFAAITEDNVHFVSEKMSPICVYFDIGAYNAIGITREEHLNYKGLILTEMKRFHAWLYERSVKSRPVFWSDNPAFDWQWINWGFHYNGLRNPFGFSARRIGDLYAGANGNIRDSTSWKRFRKTKHTHDPLDDVRGNLEAFLEIRKRFSL